MEESRYLNVLFLSVGRMNQRIYQSICAMSAVMLTFHQSLLIKKELTRKALLLNYYTIHISILLYGRRQSGVAERAKSGVQTAETTLSGSAFHTKLVHPGGAECRAATPLAK